MKKLIALVSMAFCLFKTTAAFSALAVCPDEFTISQRWFSWSSDFDVSTPQCKLGYVHSKVLSLVNHYEFYDSNDVLSAQGILRFLSWGATFDVSDAQGALIGRVEERPLNFLPTFEIITPANNVLAVARLNVLGTTYTFTDPISGRENCNFTTLFFCSQR